MFGNMKKILLWVILVSGVMSESCSSSEMPFKDEKSSVGFVFNIGKGTIKENEAIQIISTVPDKYSTQKEAANVVKNLVIAASCTSGFMADLHQAYLAKELAIADKFTHEGSKNFKLSYLLYLSQLSENEAGLCSNPNTDIVENIINRLSSAINGDKEKSQKLLKNFYSILKDTNLDSFVPE